MGTSLPIAELPKDSGGADGSGCRRLVRPERTICASSKATRHHGTASSGDTGTLQQKQGQLKMQPSQWVYDVTDWICKCNSCDRPATNQHEMTMFMHLFKH